LIAECGDADASQLVCQRTHKWVPHSGSRAVPQHQDPLRIGRPEQQRRDLGTIAHSDAQLDRLIHLTLSGCDCSGAETDWRIADPPCWEPTGPGVRSVRRALPRYAYPASHRATPAQPYPADRSETCAAKKASPPASRSRTSSTLPTSYRPAA